MRRHQANKTQRADSQRGGRRQASGQQQQSDPRRRQRDTYRACGFTTQRQNRQPAPTQRHQNQQQHHRHPAPNDHLRRGAVSRAGNPRQNLRHARIAAGLQHHQQHSEGGAERHPRQQHPVRRETAAPGSHQDHQQRRRRPQATGRQQPAESVAGNEKQHQDNTKSCAGADAQHFRAGHRVTGQALDNTPRDRQHHPGEQRGEHPRPAPRHQLIQQRAARPVPALRIPPKGQGDEERQQQD